MPELRKHAKTRVMRCLSYELHEKTRVLCILHEKTRVKHEKHTKSEQTDGHTGQIDTAKATVLCCVRACVRACMQASKAKQFPGCGNPPNLR